MSLLVLVLLFDYAGLSVSGGWSTLQHRHYCSKADHKRCSFAVVQGATVCKRLPSLHASFMDPAQTLPVRVTDTMSWAGCRLPLPQGTSAVSPLLLSQEQKCQRGQGSIPIACRWKRQEGHEVFSC